MHQHHSFLPGIFRSLLIVVVILNTTIPVRAEENTRDEEPSVLPSTDISQGLTLGTESGFVATNEIVPILSEEIEKQAQADIENKPVRLELSAEPAIYIEKKPVIIKWELKNTPQLGTNDYKIIARPPDGVLPVNKTDVPETDGSLIISPKSDNGAVAWEVLDYAEFPLVFKYELVSGEKVLDHNSVILNKPQFSISASQRKAQATPLTTDVAGKVRVELPAAAARSPLVMDIRYPSPNALRGNSLTWNPVEIIAVDVNTQKNVTEFSAPITISINYDEKKIFGWDERALTIFYYDPEINDWFPIETTVDTETNTLTAQSDHLTVFDYKANNWQSSMSPTVDAFKTSDFTGAASYQIDLWTPPGPAGLKPTISLSYNSQIVDEATVLTQSSWVGMGWDLDTGSVTRNLHGTDSDWSDDTYNISAGGISGQLIPVGSTGDIIQYNTADHAFMKVEGNNTTYTFTAWAKDGTKYVFSDTTDNNYNDGCASANHTWRWGLSSITDPNGNVINYSYIAENKAGCANEVAAYPKYITYGNGKYRITFNREARTDYQTAWTSPNSRTLYGTFRLKEVIIEHSIGIDSWETIKRYSFSYAPNNSINIYPNFNFSAGGKILTLVGVQEFDKEGIALPAVTFTYGDAMHLTQVNNGQGGIVNIAYSAWQYFDNINADIRTIATVFQTGECFFVDEDHPLPWEEVDGQVRCDGGTKYLQVGDLQGQSSIAERLIPLEIIKPSSNYNFKIDVRAIVGTTTARWGIRDTSTNQTTMLTSTGINTTGGVQSQQLITMPVGYNPNNLRLRLECGNCFFRSYDFTQYVVMYRVVSRTVIIQPTGVTSTYSYHYDNASPASKDNSEAIVAAGTNLNALYFKKLREFRGHVMSQATAPNGLTTVNWFWQADGLKGRSYDTLVLEQTFFDGLEALNSNWSGSGGTHIPTAENEKDFDNSIKSANAAANWNVSFARTASTLTDGKIAVAHIRLSGTNAQGEVGLFNGSSFVGMTLTNSGVIASGGGVLLSAGNFIKDEWYGVMFFVDANEQSRMRIWQLDNPNNVGEVTVPSMTGTWAFRARVNNGSFYTDSYFEGIPYSEVITRHEGVVLYDTTTGNNIPDIPSNLIGFKDLSITWVRTNSVENRSYNGDAAFVGTKQDFTYASLYGNLLTQVESGNNGSGWSVYRKTGYEYYPNDDGTTYIVSALARQTLKSATDTLLAETLYFYDDALNYSTPPEYGNLTMQRVWAGGSNYAQTSFSYDSYGNPSSQTVYTDFGTATANPNPASAQTTQTVYDTVGYNTYPISVSNSLSQTVYTYYDYALGVPISVTDVNNVTTSAEYDGFGRIKAITAPGDTTPTLSITYWDSRIPYQVDLVQTVSASSTIRISHFYDGAGREIQSQTANAVVDGILQNVVVDTQYNNLGQAVKKSTPYLHDANTNPSFISQTFTQPATSTDYDIIGRVSSIIAPNQTSITYAYNDLSTITFDPKDNQTETFVDVWGRTQKIQPPTGPFVEYFYDELNHLKAANRADNNTHIEYDVLGRKINMTDPDMGHWEYKYDALGNLISQTDAKNQLICLYYDALNRLDGKIYPTTGVCGPPVVFDVDYGYDFGTNGVGRRTSMSDEIGNTNTVWTYDIRGRLSTETLSFMEVQDPFVTSWNYNSGDLPVLMVYPDGETITYSYNTDGSIKSVASNTNGTIYLNDMQYDEAGRVKLMEYGNNILDKTFGYYAWDTPDMGGLLSSMVVTSTTSLQSLSYTYDKNGNVHTITDALAGPQTQTFTYDSLNRILTASASGGTDGIYSESYEYDPVTGNLSEKDSQSYSYLDPDHIHAVTNVGGNSYTYDDNGNMDARNVDGFVFDLAYDAENRLTDVTQGSQSYMPLPPLRGFSANPIRSGAFMAMPYFQGSETETPTSSPSPTATPQTFTLTLQPNGTSGADNTIVANIPTTNLGADSSLGTGERNDGSGGVARTLIKFDLSSLPANAVITSASLSLWISQDISDNDSTVNVYRLKTPFSESSSSWNLSSTGTNWQTAGASGENDRESAAIGSVVIPANETVGTEKQISLDPAKMQEYLSGTFVNNGFVLAASAELNDRFMYRSSDYGTAAQRPKLVIQYTLSDGTPTPNFTETPTTTPTLPGPTDTPTLTPTPTVTATSTATPQIFNFTLQPDGASGLDTYILSGSASSNFGTAGTLGVGERNTHTNNYARSLIKFDLSSLPSNAVITSATLSVWTQNDYSDNDRNLQVFRLKKPFTETEATWNLAATGSAWEAAGASGASDREAAPIGSALIPANESLNTEKQIALDPAMLQEMADGTFVNNGLLLQMETELNDRFDFKSSDSGPATQRPKLVIQYTLSDATPEPTFTPTITATATTVTPTRTATVSPTVTFTETSSQPPVTVFASASFTYDGDGKRVRSVITTNISSTTTYFVGAHYELTHAGAGQAGSTVTKYYYAGTQRIAMRKAGTLYFIVGDHLGSTSIITDATGAIFSETKYKAWGEVRHTTGTSPSNYTYTGQYSYTADFGLMFYNARWYDPSLGRYAQADSIIPDKTQGTQAYDRYAYVSNNPLRYNDPTGHCILCVTAAVAGGVLLGTYIYSNFIHEPSRPADGNASTVWELAYLGYEHAEHANIVGEGLQNLQSQKSLRGEQGNIIEEIRADPRYGKEAFSPDKITKDFAANGPTGKWYLAWTEPAFWMVHTGRISATKINVSEDGTISTTWKVTDTFDYKPRWDKGLLHPYNIFAVGIGFLYNGVAGAKKSFPTNAYWNQTIPPPPNACGRCE